MKFILAIVSMLLAMTCVDTSPSRAQSISDIQSSQIADNVPSAENFEKFLERDLKRYFSKMEMKNAVIRWQFLRNAPTQSGVAYPKFYLWVEILSPEGAKNAGAVRLAAIDKIKFEVTNFLSQANIKSSPDSVGEIFPAALVPKIKDYAGVE